MAVVAWPPPTPPNGRANATPILDAHPLDHNRIADALDTLIDQRTRLYYARAHRQTAMNLAPVTWTTIVFDSEQSDAQGCYNPATGEYTVAVAGLYHIAAALCFGCASTPQEFVASLWLAGAEHYRGGQVKVTTPAGGDSWGLMINCVNRYNGGEKLTVRAYNNGGNPAPVNTLGGVTNTLAVYRIAP